MHDFEWVFKVRKMMELSSLKSLNFMIKQGRIPHALLFTGPCIEELEKVSNQFAFNILECNEAKHPDIHHYSPEGKLGLHSIESIRELMNEVNKSPIKGKKKIFIVKEAERMLAASSHGLLKTLEEPSSQTCIIFLSSQASKILPTLLSRLQRIDFPSKKQRTLTKWQDGFLRFLIHGASFQDLKNLVSELEKAKKIREKELRKDLPTELSPIQKENFDKEIEGAIALEHQETIHSLLELLIEWSRDQYVLSLNVSHDILFHKSSIDELKKAPLLPLPHVMKCVKETWLLFERSLPLESCLESLFIRLNILL